MTIAKQRAGEEIQQNSSAPPKAVGFASIRRFVLVTTSFPIAADGSEAAGAFVSDLAEELGKHASVCVVAPGRSALREPWGTGVEVIRYASPTRALSTLKPWRFSDLAWIVRILIGGYHATKAAVSGERSHVIALWGLPSGEWVRRVTQGSGTGYTVWLLGSDVWTLGRLPVLRSMLSRVVKDAARRFADGYMLARDAEAISGVPVEFLPSTRQSTNSPVELPRAQPPYRFLFLGRWHPNKGVDLLLDALALLEDQDWDRISRFEIQGGGPLESKVRAGVAVLRNAGRPVVHGGYLAKMEAEAAIGRCDWLVIPSRIESIPVVFSDAVKLNRPVIATPVGDLQRLLEEFACGICCSSVDANSIADGIRSALCSRASS